MQTFLPFPAFIESAKCLDNRRLNKQITECKQIALAISDPSYGWQNHPAVRMWRGSHQTLLDYGVILYREWQRRYDDDERNGKRNHKAGESLLEWQWITMTWVRVPPSWLGNPQFHASHRAALLFKDPGHYGQFGWNETPAVPDEKGRLPYVWPGE